MFKSLDLSNFKAFHDTTLKLQPLTLIVGPNGSGKSSLLQAIRLMHELFPLSGETEKPTGIDDPRKLIAGMTEHPQYAGVPKSVTIRARNPAGDSLSWNCICLADSNPLPERSPEPMSLLQFTHWPAGHGEELVGPQNWHEVGIPERIRVVSNFGRVRRLHLDAQKLASPADGKAKRLAETGEGLAAVLAGYKLEDPSRFALIESELRSLVPVVRSIHPRRQDVLRQESELIRVGGSDVIVPRNSTVPGFALYFDTAVATGLAADQMSEGTLLLLGLLTALHDPFEADVVLLDDLDRGLHPRAQRNLIELIQALQTTWPELQVIATTHSPYLLDAIEPSQVLLTSLDDTGKVHCCALSNHPEIHRWADTMSTGELWSMVGEDWVRSAQVEAGR